MNSQPNGTPDPNASTAPQLSPAEHAEAIVVAVAVAEGLFLGIWLSLFPALALRFGGFPPVAGFFVRQAGVLHIALGLGYALDWLRHRRTTLIVVVKSATAVFLILASATEGLPWLMVGGVFIEAGTAIAAGFLHAPARRSRLSRSRPRLVTPAPQPVRSITAH